MIGGLYIDLPGTDDVGLFGELSVYTTIENIGLTNDRVSGSQTVGALVGYNYGTVETCYATGAVAGGSSSQYIGGLVGDNDGTVETSYSGGTVTSGTSSIGVGGLVGWSSHGMISNASSSAAVTGEPTPMRSAGWWGTTEARWK